MITTLMNSRLLSFVARSGPPPIETIRTVFLPRVLRRTSATASARRDARIQRSLPSGTSLAHPKTQTFVTSLLRFCLNVLARPTRLPRSVLLYDALPRANLVVNRMTCCTSACCGFVPVSIIFLISRKARRISWSFELITRFRVLFQSCFV